MSEKLSGLQDDRARKTWWNLRETEVEITFGIEDSEKFDLLKTVYSSLYSELRDKHARQQQAVAWGFTLLTGGGFVTLAFSNTLSLVGAIVFSVSLAFVTFALTRTISILSADRMSIARQLDRIHQIMGVFRKDFYCRGTTLFDPVWRGWGFDPERDVNARLGKVYQVVLWTVFASDLIVLMDKAGLIELFR